MVEARALWLVPGAEHPVYRRYAEFFRTIFRRFEVLDYRAAYLEEGRQRLEQRVVRELEKSRPELLIYAQFPNSYSYLTPQFLGSLRNTCRVVGFGFDDEIYFEQAKFFYLQCDAVITTDIPDGGRLQVAGVAVHFAQLQQPHVTPQPRQMPEDIPVSFVGDMTKPGRRALVQALEDVGIAVADFGHGSRRGRLSDTEVLEVFNRSQINLNFTRTNPPRWVLRNHPQRADVGQIKGRPFELAALGRFCLCEWAACVDYWFRPGEEIGVFRDGTELVAAAKRYLGDAALRERIAKAALARHRADYAPQVQFERIFADILAGQRRTHDPESRRAEPIFYESIGRSRAIAFLHALRRFWPLRALHEMLAVEAVRLNYWRGFTGALRDTLLARVQRS
jgi:hypothetical protein